MPKRAGGCVRGGNALAGEGSSAKVPLEAFVFFLNLCREKTRERETQRTPMKIWGPRLISVHRRIEGWHLESMEFSLRVRTVWTGEAGPCDVLSRNGYALGNAAHVIQALGPRNVSRFQTVLNPACVKAHFVVCSNSILPRLLLA